MLRGQHPSGWGQHPKNSDAGPNVQKLMERSRKHPPGRGAPQRGAAEGRAHVFLIFHGKLYDSFDFSIENTCFLMFNGIFPDFHDFSHENHDFLLKWFR